MKLVILGGGESGVGTAILGKNKGYEVFLSDAGKISNTYQKVLNQYNIEWEEGQHTFDKIFQADIVVKSPGIPDNVLVVKELKKRSIKVVSEIEFAYPFAKNISIAVTGSNGKTTTTMLIHHILKQSGLNIGIGGNIGDSYAKQLANNPNIPYVLELSSFQLDGIEMYKPHIAVITNISPDHLDRYDYQYEKYIASKFRIAMNQTEEDVLIYDADDEAINEWFSKNNVKSKKLPFSLSKEVEEGAYLNNDNIIIKIEGEKYMIPVGEISIEGKHNVKNAMAASLVSQMMKIRKQTIRESLSGFKGVEHRLEKVAVKNNVQYINDSKATNVDAVYFALEGIKTPIVWIVGGVDKGNDYDALIPFVKSKVKAIICLGKDNSKLVQTFKNTSKTLVEVRSMKDAVSFAHQIAEQGDTVLLSPACASFDLFENYQDRGNQFKEEVKGL